jgi:Arc/MetJ family transcription regulator
MRTTLNLNDALLDEARRLTGIHEKTALLHHALEELIARRSAHALAALGGKFPKLNSVPRRRTARHH